MSRRETGFWRIIGGRAPAARAFTPAGVSALSAAIEEEAGRRGGELFVYLPGDGDYGAQFLAYIELSRKLKNTMVLIAGDVEMPARAGLQVVSRGGGGPADSEWTVVWSSPSGGAAFTVARVDLAGRNTAPYQGHVAFDPATVMQAREEARRLVVEFGGRDPGPRQFNAPSQLLGEELLLSAAWTLQARATEAERRAEQSREMQLSLSTANAELVERLITILNQRDPETGGHLRRIGWYAQQLAETMGQDIAYCLDIGFASTLHDIGKVAIPDAVLMEEGKLDEEAWAKMREHPEIGARILGGSSSPLLQMAERIALCHHERWDGKGYPHKLAAESIPLEAQITAVVDAFDAMTSTRRHREAWPVDRALAEIRMFSGTQFGPEVVAAFLANPPVPPAPAPGSSDGVAGA